MKFFFRILGTWLLGLALVLFVRDIVLSFVSLSIISPSLSQTWNDLHAPSWLALSDYLTSSLTQFGAKKIIIFIFNLPAWLIPTILGILLLIIGRNKNTKLAI